MMAPMLTLRLMLGTAMIWHARYECKLSRHLGRDAVKVDTRRRYEPRSLSSELAPPGTGGLIPILASLPIETEQGRLLLSAPCSWGLHMGGEGTPVALRSVGLSTSWSAYPASANQEIVPSRSKGAA